MKQPNKNFDTWVFQGFESHQMMFRGDTVGHNSWYIGTCNGTIAAGSFATEHSAAWNASQMQDTSGT